MGRYKKFTHEFKRDVLAMMAEGTRSIAKIERDLHLTPGLIYKWQQRCHGRISSTPRPFRDGKLCHFNVRYNCL